jgi:hypothetical protein
MNNRSIPSTNTERKITDLSDTLAARGLEEIFFQLYCRVSFWFWREIGFGLHTYVLRVPYSCGVVSVLVLLAGNSFWYIRTYHTVVVLC